MGHPKLVDPPRSHEAHPPGDSNRVQRFSWAAVSFWLCHLGMGLFECHWSGPRVNWNVWVGDGWLKGANDIKWYKWYKWCCMLFPLNSLIPFLYTIVSMGLYKSQEAITFHLPSQLELESSTKTPKHQLIPLASQRCLKCRSKRCLINWHGSIHKWIKILAWKIHMKNAQTHSATTSKVLKCVYSVEMCCLHTLNWCCGRVRKPCGYLKLCQTKLTQFRSAQDFPSQD